MLKVVGLRAWAGRVPESGRGIPVPCCLQLPRDVILMLSDRQKAPGVPVIHFLPLCWPGRRS